MSMYSIWGFLGAFVGSEMIAMISIAGLLFVEWQVLRWEERQWLAKALLISALLWLVCFVVFVLLLPGGHAWTSPVHCGWCR